MKIFTSTLSFLIFPLIVFSQLDDTGSTSNGSMTLGAGTGTLYQFAGDQRGSDGTNQSQGGFGILSGPNQISPIIWMYSFGDRNAFQVRRKGYGSTVQNAATLFQVDVNGKVGIGTTNPSAHFEINKNVNGSLSAFLLNQNTSSNSRAILLIGEQSTGGNYGYLAHHSQGHATNWGNYESANSTWLVGSDTSGLNIIAGNSQGKIVFGTSSTEKMRIANNGNVGIGTTNTNGWKLAVNGEIRAKEIKVETGWSDFVFYDDYPLPTLQEVEKHIQEKGHLKDIPSAGEVKQNGIYLGQMDSKLLQKIEELTLYTIQQQKEIDALKLQNQKLLGLQTRLEKLEAKR